MENGSIRQTTLLYMWYRNYTVREGIYAWKPWGLECFLGRRTSKNNEQYSYNVRDELIAADNVSYNYDDIGIYAPTSVSEVGNRTTAEGKTYTANNLNQYTAIDDFVPEYDADGNQTLVKTATGIWQVVYNAENRPICWTQGNRVVTMDFDRLGRRVFYREMVGDVQVTHTVFLYNGYLCIQQLLSNELWHVYKEFIWDPTEPVATRPLAFQQYGKTATFLMHDGNKKVTDVVTTGPRAETAHKCLRAAHKGRMRGVSATPLNGGGTIPLSLHPAIPPTGARAPALECTPRWGAREACKIKASRVRFGSRRDTTSITA